MKIIKDNKEKLESIFIHDAYMLNIIYNNNLKKITIDFLSTWEEYHDLELIFNNVYYFNYQNFNLFGIRECTQIYNIILNEKFEVLSDLIDRYENENKIIDDENKKSEIKKMKKNLKNLDASKLMEIVINTLSGGELIILCEEIIVNEL